MGMKPNPTPLRVLIADDHEIVRTGIAAIISSAPDMRVIALASSGREAIALFSSEDPDIVLMDCRMKELDGFEATREIRRRKPNAKVLLLSAFEFDDYVSRALVSGAGGFLFKDASAAEILAAVRALAAGETVGKERTANADDEGRPRLSSREMEVLRLLTRGYSNNRIAEELFITVGTVKCHVNNVLWKLGVEDRTQAALSAIRTGLVEL